MKLSRPFWLSRFRRYRTKRLTPDHQGPNKASGQVQAAGNGSNYQTYITGPYDPNGGYYYARVSFNF